MGLIGTPTTELEAVNEILQVIGEQPILSLDNPGFLAASMARDTLTSTSREIQARGLHCNTEKSYPLVKGIDGRIRLPLNTLEVDSSSDSSTDAVRRGEYLYDKTKRTLTFDGDVTVDITFFLDFEELPQHVKTYVTIKAARRLLVRTVGAVDLYKMTAVDEEEAMIAFKRAELKAKDLNFGQSSAVSGIINR